MNNQDINAAIEKSRVLAHGIECRLTRHITASDRGHKAIAYFHIVGEHHLAVIDLLEKRRINSAFTLLRPMFEGVIKGLSIAFVLTDDDAIDQFIKRSKIKLTEHRRKVLDRYRRSPKGSDEPDCSDIEKLNVKQRDRKETTELELKEMLILLKEEYPGKELNKTKKKLKKGLIRELNMYFRRLNNFLSSYVHVGAWPITNTLKEPGYIGNHYSDDDVKSGLVLANYAAHIAARHVAFFIDEAAEKEMRQFLSENPPDSIYPD